MKKVSTLALSLLLSINSFAQLTGISPNTGVLNQYIITTISGNNIFFSGSSPAGNLSEVNLQKAGCYASSENSTELYINNNTASCAMYLPGSGSCTGLYNLEVQTSTNTYNLSNAFTVLPPSHYISGKVYVDLNLNKVYDAGDTIKPYQHIVVNPGSIGAYTDKLGNYLIPVSSGNYTVQWVPSSGFALSTDSSSYTVAVSGASTGYNFGIKSNLPAYTTTINLYSSNPICNQNVNYWINYNNVSNYAYNGYTYFVKDDSMTFVSSLPVPSSVNGDTLFYNLTNVVPFSSGYISMVFTMPSAGNILTSSATILAIDSLGGTGFTNMTIKTQTVNCSFDPNDKAVNPPGEYSQHYTLFTDTLEYLIRFQNTGTATAFNIVVQDWLDPNLNLNSFEIVGSSHNMKTKLLSNGSLTFTFNNINLPDSNANEPASHGWIKYTILPDAGLPVNTVVYNTAYIFFDQNPPVATNTTFNTLVNVIPVSVSENVMQPNGVIVMPNPMSDETHLIFPNSNNNLFYLKITSADGKIVGQDFTQTGHFVVKRGYMKPGVYFYKLSNRGRKSYFGKFIVQ